MKSDMFLHELEKKHPLKLFRNLFSPLQKEDIPLLNRCEHMLKQAKLKQLNKLNTRLLPDHTKYYNAHHTCIVSTNKLNTR